MSEITTKPPNRSRAYDIYAEVAETLRVPSWHQEPDSQHGPDIQHDIPAQSDTGLNCSAPLYLSIPPEKNPFETEAVTRPKLVRKPCPAPTMRTPAAALSQQQVRDVAQPPRDRSAAERLAKNLLAAGKTKFEKGLCKEAINVYQVGLLLLSGWENTTAWADVNIAMGMANTQAGKEAQAPQEKRRYFTQAKLSFDAAQLIYTQELKPKVWDELEEHRYNAERWSGNGYIPAIYIPRSAAVEEQAENSGGFHWSTLEQAIATLQQQKQSIQASEKKIFENMVAGDTAYATPMLISRDARIHNSEPHEAANKAAERLAALLVDSAVELAILEGGKAQKRRAQTVLAAYQGLANTDSAMEALKWAKGLLAQEKSQLYRAFSTITPDLKRTLETTIVQPALLAIEAAYDVGPKSRYVDPNHERDKIFANVLISTLRTAMLIRDLPNQRKAMNDPGSASDRGTNYWGRAAWPIKGNWTWGNVMTLEQGGEQLLSGEYWNGARYALPAAGSLITFTNAWSKSFPTVDPLTAIKNWEFPGLRNLVAGKTPDRAGTLLNDIFNSKWRLVQPVTVPLAAGIRSMADWSVGRSEDLPLEEVARREEVRRREQLQLKQIENIETIESRLKALAEKMNANPVLSKFQSAFVAAEPWIVGLAVDGIAFWEHGVNREFSIANGIAAAGDALGFFANIALSIANHGADFELKMKMLKLSTRISWTVQGLQLFGEFLENLIIQTLDKSKRIYPEHPFHGGLILYGGERESVMWGDSRTGLVTMPLAIKNWYSDVLYQQVRRVVDDVEKSLKH